MSESSGSSKPTRDDRLERQQLDEGDPDVVVYTSKGPSGSAYHEDRDCSRIVNIPDDEIRTDTRREAKLRWRAPCQRCILGEKCSP